MSRKTFPANTLSAGWRVADDGRLAVRPRPQCCTGPALAEFDLRRVFADQGEEGGALD